MQTLGHNKMASRRLRLLTRSLQSSNGAASCNDIPKDSMLVHKFSADGFTVRTMTMEDLKTYRPYFKDEIIISPYDIEIPIKICTGIDGPVVAVHQGDIIGTTTHVRWSDNVAYSGAVHFRPEYRGKGYSRRFWCEAIEADWISKDKTSVGETVRVQMTDAEHMRFFGTSSSQSAKMALEAKSYEHSYSLSPGVLIQKATEVKMDAIMAFDSQCFVPKDSALRRPFLEHWIRVPGGAAYVAVNAEGDVLGFGCRRPALLERQHMIGPLYAVNDDIALALVAHLSSDVIGQKLVLSIRYTHPYAVNFAERCGFKIESMYNRVYYGPAIDDYNPYVYGVTSLACCGF